MKKFEIPYNFDPKIIDFIIDNNYSDYISEIYVAPFIDDYAGAKRYYCNPGHTEISSQPKERIEYEKHLKKILDSGLRLSILFQNQEHLLTEDMLRYYVDLGATTFVVNNDETAKLIKAFNPQLKVIASITKKLSFSDFHHKDLSMYDEFVLYFPFNRALDRIKELPPQYKYILLVNCGCGYTCPGTHHWFAGCDEDGKELVKGPGCVSGLFDQIIVVLPTNLEIFDPYISGYKLQGREYSTPELLMDIKQYIKREMFNPFIQDINTDIEKKYDIITHYNVALEDKNNIYLY